MLISIYSKYINNSLLFLRYLKLTQPMFTRIILVCKTQMCFFLAVDFIFNSSLEKKSKK